MWYTQQKFINRYIYLNHGKRDCFYWIFSFCLVWLFQCGAHLRIFPAFCKLSKTQPKNECQSVVPVSRSSCRKLAVSAVREALLLNLKCSMSVLIYPSLMTFNQASMLPLSLQGYSYCLNNNMFLLGTCVHVLFRPCQKFIHKNSLLVLQ